MSDHIPVAHGTDVEAALDRMAAQILAAGDSAAGISTTSSGSRSAGRPHSAEPRTPDSMPLTLQGIRRRVGAGGIVEVMTPPYEDDLGVVLRFERT